jgi:hypothetical protein
MSTLRETIVSAIAADAELQTMGLPINNVFDSDTAESPAAKPFLVIRFMEGQKGLAHVNIRPFDIWAYVERGDRTLAERLADRAGSVVAAISSAQTDTGWILQIDKGQQGADLSDAGFDALVVPLHMTAIASGV